MQVRINRNIVECKVASVPEFARIGTCINRNIVECKELSLIRPFKVVKVLIETLWNVKYIEGITDFECVKSINRNIVECKGEITSAFANAGLVLIETLWNVKEKTQLS